MLNKAKAQVTALNKDLQNGLERQIFGFVQGHISHRKFTEAVF
jgi:hypothetical protein